MDAFQDDAPVAVRKPGQFARHARTGAPFVADPVRTTKRTGTKAELIAECAAAGISVPEKATVATLQQLLGPRPVMVQYGRPSGLGKQIENQTNLQKWAERMVALGIARAVDNGEPGMAADLGAMTSLDSESAEFKEAADTVAVKAKAAAQAHLAAERGTHHHELTEDVDNDRDPILRMVRGEELGVPFEVQCALIDAWQQMLEQFGIEILATEATCVDDLWRQAGTLDRVCRLTRDLRFVTVTGEYVTLPAGWVGILDIKTGRLRLDRAGFVAYWHGYAVQLASYAQSQPYDPDSDTRGVWPWPIDQQWAIIAHLDVLAALDGEAVCRLVLVDLEAGRNAGNLCVAARAWERRTDVFSLPIEDLAVRVPVGDGLPVSPELDVDDVDEIAPTVEAAPTVGATPQQQKDALAFRRPPAEGGDVADGFDTLRRRYATLTVDARTWIAALTEQAIQAGVSFHSASSHTVRRYEIIRGLVALCDGDDRFADDDILRGLLELVIGDVAQFPAVTPGAALGSLNVHEAATFARHCDQLVDGDLAVTARLDGSISLQPAA